MLNPKIVLLDGCKDNDTDLTPVLDILLDELKAQGADVQLFSPRNLKMGTCVGCFGCWLKTPGICLEPDAGRDIAEAVVQSDMTILLSPVTFGGYSSEIKKAQDRWLPLVLPDFGIYHGEVHHVPRYSTYPRLVGIGIQRHANEENARLVGIGIQRHANEENARLFKMLVGRNALNFHTPSYAAEVLLSTDSPDRIRQSLRAVLVRNDSLPLSSVAQSQMVALKAKPLRTRTPSPITDAPKRALLLIGSPKVNDPSTSGVLGQYVLKQLEAEGWETECLTLRKARLTGQGQSDFLRAVDQATLIVLAFPLYIDSLPFLLMKALEIMAQHLTAHSQGGIKQLVAIANNGFPEAHHNALALSICQRFAIETGMIWSGGLALGAGEALFGGMPIAGSQRSGRPPVKHVTQALDIASRALAKGDSVPEEAVKLMAQQPIPVIPYWLWRWLFIKMAYRHWRQGAAINQVEKNALLAQPYADGG